MRKRIFYSLTLAILIVTIFACKENSQERLRRIELENLDKYVQDNNLQEYRKSSGLYYIELEEGVGDAINLGDRIQIFYSTRTLVDSFLVDETEGYTDGYRYEPYEFVVGNGIAIDGLEEAATYMQKGTKANLIIPSELAYGQNGTTYLPGFTTLLMQVEVYKVFPAQ